MFALIAALAVAAVPAFAAEEKATFTISPISAPELCLAVNNATNGSGLKLSKCTNGAGTAYTYSTKTAHLTAFTEEDLKGEEQDDAHHHCIDVTDGKAHNGNLLQHWICAIPSDNQVFDFDPVEGKEDKNIYTIKWSQNDYCFDVKDGNFTEGADVQIWRCVPSNTNQQWTVANIADPTCDGATDGSLETYAEEAQKLEAEQQHKRGLNGHRRRTIF
ncbi:hypothetical protein A1Q2_01074 [Trichosporon asahii var. asahii CBS 8904]|uniref:Ricin B lectin domain-containing protein n=2 Tax=Trichosporon asahii var. asahii TaxID=189963 RepID=K1WUU1_TRIAC|nr:hypothetical protein A1Q1_07587 [Trichosporon asahii var. asahii CBS 2479]EJT51230.1 hypothetical protein A1Q1_07587 [Trichosporon asahii var. asahii CBS 2479]EKD04614.1 hypothetical protein A1Q2_01074 [Trichosporon asahii var. asahii CBS 8904]